MSFEKLNKKDLVAAAELFGVDSTGTKEKILAELDAEGVTFELYTELTSVNDGSEPDEAEVVPAASGPDTIVVFRGQGGYSNPHGNWSAKSPFVVVPKSVADELIEEMPGIFDIGSEREVENFYS